MHIDSNKKDSNNLGNGLITVAGQYGERLIIALRLV